MMGGRGPGDGYGRGMMDGYGPGGGYGAGAGLAALNLTDEQREKIARIQEDNRSKNWNTMGQMRGEMFKLRQMYFGDKLDSNVISEQQRKVDELRRADAEGADRNAQSGCGSTHARAAPAVSLVRSLVGA